MIAVRFFLGDVSVGRQRSRSPQPRRRRPAKLYADKGYDYDHLRRWLRTRRIVPRIARKGVESSQRLGRHRWTVERTVRGWPGVAACTVATNARPATSWPSSGSPPP